MTELPKVAEQVRRLSVSESGRVLIPVEMREKLDVRAGGSVLARVEGNKLILEPFSSTLARIRQWTQQFSVPGESLADELIADRRREAERD